jgi:hypothetical protein
MTKLLFISLVSILTGCAQYSLQSPRTLEEQRSYIDKTVSVPSIYFMETSESKSIHVGSSIFAQAAGCQFMQRYKVRTNANFTQSLNLLKYRSAMMGAKRITIVKHEEVDANESRIVIRDDNVIYLQAGTSIVGSEYHSTITADLYDCGK